MRDETGNRRFWPILCNAADLESLSRDRDQVVKIHRVRGFDRGKTAALSTLSGLPARRGHLPYLVAACAVGAKVKDAPERVRLLNDWGTSPGPRELDGGGTRSLPTLAISESVTTPPDVAALLHNLAAVELQTGSLGPVTLHETKALAILRQPSIGVTQLLARLWLYFMTAAA